MTYNPQESRWTRVIDLPANQSIEWKCIMRNNDTPDIVRWQPGPNVRFTSGAASVTRGTF
ncbi:Starch binding domain protein [compost metagenome]